jgi:uncharacterized protein YqeY
MTLEFLQSEMISAMKSNNVAKRDVLRSVIAAVKKAAIDNRCEATEELIDKVLIKEAKTIQEQIDTCPDERVDLKIEYGSKAAILNEYVPKLLDNPEEIKAMIENQLAIAGIEPLKSNKGAVMKTVMPVFKGKADMKIVNQVIGEILK